MKYTITICYLVAMLGCASLLELSKFEIEAAGYDVEVEEKKTRTIESLEQELSQCREEKKGWSLF